MKYVLPSIGVCIGWLMLLATAVLPAIAQHVYRGGPAMLRLIDEQSWRCSTFLLMLLLAATGVVTLVASLTWLISKYPEPAV